MSLLYSSFFPSSFFIIKTFGNGMTNCLYVVLFDFFLFCFNLANLLLVSLLSAATTTMTVTMVET